VPGAGLEPARLAAGDFESISKIFNISALGMFSFPQNLKKTFATCPYLRADRYFCGNNFKRDNERFFADEKASKNNIRVK